jgi:hypothetical protein
VASVLTWFDADPARFWWIAWSTFAALALIAAVPAFAGAVSEFAERRLQRQLPPWLFLLALAATLLAFRWPILFIDRDFNIDESQHIAEAITLQHDPVFWRSVDGTTHGPLDIYPLLLLPLVGLKLDYFGVRVFGLFLMAVALVASYRALALLGRESLARIAILPAVAFIAFTTAPDFIHYSSEHVPVALLATGLWLAVADLLRTDRRPRSWRWILAGLGLGAVPMAKLQAAPIAATLLVAVVLLDFLLPGSTPRDRIRRPLVLAAAALLPTFVFILLTWIFGVLHHAWISYVSQNFNYAHAGHVPLGAWFLGSWKFFQHDAGFGHFITGLALLSAIAAIPALQARPAQLRWCAITLVVLLASLFAVLAPRREYFHYQLLLVVPATLFAGTLVQSAWESLQGPRARWTRLALLAALCVVAILPQIRERSRGHLFVGQLQVLARPPDDPVPAEILRYTQPGDRLAVWGWAPRFYVRTGLPQATREAHTYNELTESGLQPYYYHRYVRDLARRRPVVFVDAVGPGAFGFVPREHFAHERFPELHEIIARDYRHVAEFGHARIYVRLDRLPPR